MNSTRTKPLQQNPLKVRTATLVALVIVMVAAACGGVWWRIAVRRYWDELKLAEQDYSDGNYSLAYRRLSARGGLAGRGKVVFRLGICELARGRREQAGGPGPGAGGIAIPAGGPRPLASTSSTWAGSPPPKSPSSRR